MNSEVNNCLKGDERNFAKKPIAYTHNKIHMITFATTKGSSLGYK